MKLGDRSIAAERSAEIATKKLIYRASTYTARDLFDLAAIYLCDRSALTEIALCPAITDHVVLSALIRLNLIKQQYQSDMRRLINSTPRGEQFIDKSCEIALEALAEIRNLIPKKIRPNQATGCSVLKIACRGACSVRSIAHDRKFTRPRTVTWLPRSAVLTAARAVPNNRRGRVRERFALEMPAVEGKRDARASG